MTSRTCTERKLRPSSSFLFPFPGFSYEVSACQSRAQLIKEFTDARQNFNARFVRMYGACDNDGFMDDVIEAAWEGELALTRVLSTRSVMQLLKRRVFQVITL